MPKASTTQKSSANRTAPYQLRSTTSTEATSMAAAVASPLITTPAWDHVSQHAWAVSNQSPYTHYQPQMIIPNSYHTIPPAHSVAPAVQMVHNITQDLGLGGHVSASAPWTAEMDELLIDNHKRMKWDQIAEKLFNNSKTGNACRKRFARVLAERKEPARWDQHRVHKVVSAYNQRGIREKTWKCLADATGEKWEDVERLCFGQGYRIMVSRPSLGHSSRRQSGAASSHRSNLSNVSDYGHPDFHNEKTCDDSGIGDDMHDHQHTRILDGDFPPCTTTYHGRHDRSDVCYRY